MFEDSLIASGVSLEQSRNAGRTRLIAMASVAIQGLVLGAFIALPTIWPERLPLVSIAPKLASLTLKKPQVKVEPKPIHVETMVDNAVQAPAQPQPLIESRVSNILHLGNPIAQAAEAPAFNFNVRMTSGTSISPIGAVTGTGSSPVVVPGTKPGPPPRISDGVTEGMLLSPIRPVYPRMAIMARVEGTVVVTATIDKQGRVTGLQVVSGNPMLTSAAMDAIKDARYKPYLLNGEPTNIITTISVNFRLGQS